MFKFAAGVLKEIVVGFLIIFFGLMLIYEYMPETPRRYISEKTGEYYTTKELVRDSRNGVWSFEWDTLIHSVEETLEEDFGEYNVEKKQEASIPSFEDLQNNYSISPVVNGGEILIVRGMPVGDKRAYVSKIYFMCQERGGRLDRDKYRMYAVEHTFNGNQEEIFEYLKKLYTDELGKGKSFDGKLVQEGIMWGNIHSYVMLQRVENGTAKPKTRLVYTAASAEKRIASLAEAIAQE